MEKERLKFEAEGIRQNLEMYAQLMGFISNPPSTAQLEEELASIQERMASLQARLEEVEAELANI